MLTTFIRTVILLIVVIVVLRIMGKRQIGQLQTSEFVVAILLSQIAATPMQDNDIPLINSIIALSVLMGLEIIISAVNMKSDKIRSVLQGNTVMLVKNGVIDQFQLKRLRYTVDDVLEALREKNVFDISEVQYAVAETNGSISVILKSQYQTATKEDVKANDNTSGIPIAVICDGQINSSEFSEINMTKEKLYKLLQKLGVTQSEVFLLTLNKSGNINLVKKEKKQ